MNAPINAAAAAADPDRKFDATTFWQTFRHGEITVQGTSLHYVAGGSGAPILLIPGWPQSWYAWRYVMPLLVAAGRRVIALDPRGMGDSARPASGYDMTTAAAEMHAFVQALGLNADGPIDVVGHDIGTWIGYAYAADWPADVRRLAVFDAALPGITAPPSAGIPSAQANVKSWHFAFNRLDDLPEILLQGRERAFLTWLFRAKAVKTWTIGPADLEEYLRVNQAPGALRAALSYYRTAFSPEALAQSRVRATQPLTMPVLAVGAAMGVGTVLIDTMRQVASHVTGGVLEGVGHYLPEECPDALVDRLKLFFRESGG